MHRALYDTTPHDTNRCFCRHLQAPVSIRDGGGKVNCLAAAYHRDRNGGFIDGRQGKEADIDASTHAGYGAPKAKLGTVVIREVARDRTPACDRRNDACCCVACHMRQSTAATGRLLEAAAHQPSHLHWQRKQRSLENPPSTVKQSSGWCCRTPRCSQHQAPLRRALPSVAWTPFRQ